MAELVYGMNQSLDGYVNHDAFGPGPKLFQHFVDYARGLAGSLYGRGLYELMVYWDEDQPDWGDAERAFALAWRAQPKWVVSNSLAAVGPNTTLLRGDLDTEVRRLKAQITGTIDVGGPTLARSLGELGLIDTYRIYLHPVVLGAGVPFFAGPRPRLRLTSVEDMGEDIVSLTYVPA